MPKRCAQNWLSGGKKQEAAGTRRKAPGGRLKAPEIEGGGRIGGSKTFNNCRRNCVSDFLLSTCSKAEPQRDLNGFLLAGQQPPSRREVRTPRQQCLSNWGDSEH